MSTSTHLDEEFAAPLVEDDLASALSACEGDSKQFLRRLVASGAHTEGVICALLEDLEGERWWLARATSADAAVRDYLAGVGFEVAATAHAIDLDCPHASVGPDTEWRMLRGPSGRRLVLARTQGDWVAVDRWSWGLALLDQGTELQRVREDLTRAQQRLLQIRAGLRAGVQAGRAFEDLDEAGRWLVDLRGRFTAQAAALILDDVARETLLLSDVESTEELQGRFLARSLAVRAETTRCDENLPLRWQNLSEGSWSVLTPGSGTETDDGAWPSFVSVAVRTPKGEDAWVFLGSRLPSAFAPESVAMMRSSVGAMAHGFTQLLESDRRRRQELGRMLRELPVGLLLVEEDGILSVVNDEARQLLELRSVPADLGQLSSASGLAFVDLHQRFKTVQGSETAVSNLEVGPSGRPVGVQVRQVSDDGSGRGCWLWTLRDIGAEQRRERARAEFVSTVGHELKTPLTSMQTALELLETGELGELNSEQLHFVQLGLRGSQRMAARVNQLLDMARLEAGRLSLRRESVDVVHALEASLADLELRAHRERRYFECRLPATAMAFVDPVRVGEIVENLVSNAFKFCSRVGRVSLELRAGMPHPLSRDRELARLFAVEVEGIEIEVRDEGSGMAPSTLQHAFDPFYQEGDPLSDRPEGAGLGLSIVRSLVEAHAGEIEVESELDQGTAVRIWIPGDERGADFQSGLHELRRRLDVAANRGESLRIALTGATDGPEFALGLELRIGRHAEEVEAASRPPVAQVEFPADGLRAGTLLAELKERLSDGAAVLAEDRSGKARND